MRYWSVFLYSILIFVSPAFAQREKMNFNADWRLFVGDVPEAVESEFDDSGWKRVTLPYAFNGDEAGTDLLFVDTGDFETAVFGIVIGPTSGSGCLFCTGGE